MNSILAGLQKWSLDIDHVRRQMYRAPTPRVRERWHALWLVTQDWTATRIAEALGRDSYTMGVGCRRVR